MLVVVAAFVLSLLSLVSSLLIAWVRWPRIAVEAPQTTILDSRSRDVVRLTVINRGAEAATIWNIGLSSEGGSRKLDYQELEVIRLSGLDDADQPAGPKLPCRIEGNGCLIWVYTDDMLARCFVKDNRITAYADRYTLFRFWPWWPREPLIFKWKRVFGQEGTVVRH